MTTVRLPVEKYEEFRKRALRRRPHAYLETKAIGKTFKEVRTGLSRAEIDQLCKGLGPVHITETT
jgi:hypothetical protein